MNYQDMEGDEISLYKLVKSDPNWASSRIKAGQLAIEQLATLTAERDNFKACYEAKSIACDLAIKAAQDAIEVGRELNVAYDDLGIDYFALRKLVDAAPMSSKPKVWGDGVEEIKKRPHQTEGPQPVKKGTN